MAEIFVQSQNIKKNIQIFVCSICLVTFFQMKKIHIFFRAEKQLSVFNVVKFPNDPCGAANGYNGTCFTNTECISRGGLSSVIVIWTFNIF